MGDYQLVVIVVVVVVREMRSLVWMLAIVHGGLWVVVLVVAG